MIKPRNSTPTKPTPSRLNSRLGRTGPTPQHALRQPDNQEALKPVRGITLSSKPHGVLRGYIKERNINDTLDVKKKSRCFCFICFVFFVCFLPVSVLSPVSEVLKILGWVWFMRLVGYVRTSSEERDGGGQEFAIYQWASRNGHQIVEIFRDIGISGVTPLDVRPGWVRLMERLSEVDGIIVESLDRISRDPEQLLDVLRRLEAMGKVIISVSDNGVNQLLKINDPDLRRVIIDIASIKRG